MNTEITVDEDGFELSLKKLKNGRWIGNNFNADTVNNMPSIHLRNDDVIFCSYMKSGCHWVWQNVRMLLDGQVHSDAVDKESMMMEYHTIDHLDSLSSPRILNTHQFFDSLPTDLLKGKTKLIFVYRNPKDIAVSSYYHYKRLEHYNYKAPFSSYLKRFEKGLMSNNRIFDYLNNFEEGLKENPQIPYIAVSYEDMQKNPVSERHRLATFLGKSYSDEFINEVVTATSINVMREQKGADVFYRKGEVGDWKNHFTVAENMWFDDVIREELKGFKLVDFKYTV